jgi:hypothetical protein
MNLSSKSRLRIKKRGGIVVPEWVSDDLLEDLTKFESRADDVTVVTFPKVGTTWMLQIVHLILNGGKQGKTPLNKTIGWFERDSISTLNNISSPRLIKTHLPINTLPASYQGKYIYVARRPEDVAVSYYYHARAKIDFRFQGEWETFFQLFLDGEVEGGDWYQHTHSGKNFSENNPDNTLLIWYEDIHDDIISIIKKTAIFLNINLADNVINQIAKNSHIDYMRQSSLTNVQWSEEREGESPHLRNGVVGDGITHLSPKQRSLIYNKWGDSAKLKSHLF